MKKLFFLASVVTMSLVLFSCSSSKEARTYKKTVDGSWQLQTITTEGITGKVKAQILEEADFNCFVGSQWKFNQYNSLGSYEISKNGGECVAVKRNIRWSIYEESGMPKMLQYKRVDDKYKDIDAEKAGFRFTIISLDNNTMQLKSNITFEGKPAAFIYNFVRS
ncbi:lipocalin family protein [Ferruginibacter yonginensis]|uniref:Lipocalin family protein n=1 Tax=Ferruginibacter yonginensis TaxID=1310416 RepID=A0ABV8QV56_9BACT